MILSDRTLREQLDAGRIIIDPLGPNSLQPSSIDLRLDRFFRVFKNHAMGHIDVKQNLEELTELVEAPDSGEEPFILHPGEFVLGSTLERRSARRSRRSSGGQVVARAPRIAHSLDGRLRRRRVSTANSPLS